MEAVKRLTQPTPPNNRKAQKWLIVALTIIGALHGAAVAEVITLPEQVLNYLIIAEIILGSITSSLQFTVDKSKVPPPQ